jgi:hypothetical protein
MTYEEKSMLQKLLESSSQLFQSALLVGQVPQVCPPSHPPLPFLSSLSSLSSHFVHV